MLDSLLNLCCVLAGSVFCFLAYAALESRKPYATVFAVGVPILLFVCTVGPLMRNTPFLDDYVGILDYLALGSLDRWRHLFDFWNEHRIAFPRLVFQISGWMFGVRCIWGGLVLGNLIYLGYVLLVARQCNFNQVVLPFVWIWMDLANYENTLWTFASIQNHSVLLFALLSMVCLEKGMRAGKWVLPFCLALVFASLATFSSAPGIAVWPALMCMGARRWASCRRSEGDIGFIGRGAILLCASILVGMFFFDGYFEVAQRHTARIRACYPASLHPVWDAVDYFVCFCGAVVPFRSVAFPVGILVLTMSLAVLLSPRRVENEAMFGMLVFGLAVAAAGAVSRSEPSHSVALSCRYGSTSVSIVAVATVLFHDLMEKRGHAVPRWVVHVLFVGGILIHLGTLQFGYRCKLEHARYMDEVFRKWPHDLQGVKTTCQDVDEAVEAVRRAEAAGVYKIPRD